MIPAVIQLTLHVHFEWESKSGTETPVCAREEWALEEWLPSHSLVEFLRISSKVPLWCSSFRIPQKFKLCPGNKNIIFQ